MLLVFGSLACHAEPEGLRIAFIGDSISHGCLPRDGRDCVGFVELIARALPDRFEVINAAVPGATTWSWVETEVRGHPIGYEVWLEPHLPIDWAVVLLGANDAHRHLPFISKEPIEPSRYEAGLRRLVRRLSEGGVGRITLLAPLPQRRTTAEVADRLDAYREIVADLCAEGPPLECGPELDDMPASGFRRDGIHPNASGHAWLAGRLLAAWRSSGDIPAAAGPRS